MKRIALIAATSAAALAASLAMAQPQPIPQAPGPGGGPDAPRHERMRDDLRVRDDRGPRGDDRREEWRAQRAERMTTRLNERLAKLRADMKLKPEQVALFDRVEEMVKRRSEQRRENWSAMHEQRENFRHADIMEKLDATANRQAERAARSKEIADAVRPLWTTLSDEQKTVARRAVREAMAENHRGMGRRGDRWEERRGGRDHDRFDERGPRSWHGRDRDRERQDD